jgi:hypothetical protein
MTQKEFIQNVLIDEVEDIVSRHPYLSFVSITAGIELLGILIESPKNYFWISDKSSTRFQNAIDSLFPNTYHQYKKILYKELRCGMNHALLTKQNIGLSERRHGLQNLSIKNNQLILVVEDFFYDYKNACFQVIQKLDDGLISERFNLNLI